MTTHSAPLLPVPSPLRAGRPRVSVITGSYGAGHDSAAREIARVLGSAGCEVEVHDIVPLLPYRLGPILRAAYYTQLRCRPGSWDTTLRLVGPGRPLNRLAGWLLARAIDPVLQATRGADLVVTTHPFGAQVLGQARQSGRQSGRLTMPVATYLTDTSVHALWVHPAVDLHLAIHPIAAEEARSWGGTAAVVQPLVPASAVDPTPVDGDPLLGEGVIGPRALLTGGSLGMGDLERSARDVLATGLMTPVVLCGTDTRLQRRLARIRGVVALGWRDDIAALMRSSDCVVQNAGGFTSLEALHSGTPVITYRPLPGHGVANARNLDAAGLIPWAQTPADLALLLRAAMHAPRIDRLPRGGSDLAELLLGSRELVAA